MSRKIRWVAATAFNREKILDTPILGRRILVANCSEDGSAPSDGDQLDSAGQTIRKLLHKAADAAEANSQPKLSIRWTTPYNASIYSSV
jgi:hypothetical protein